MDPAFQLPTQFAPVTQQGWNGGNETQVFPRFYKWAKPMPAQSQAEGMMISVPVDMVEIRQAGETDYVREEVNANHRNRWPQHWAAYQAGQEQIQTGTPLDQLFLANPEVVADLKRFNVHTIQALAGLPDSAGDKIPFLTDWKKKADIYLKGVEKGKGFHELERQLTAASQTNRELSEKMAALEAKLEAALTKKE